jgi:hypothetical protein
MVAELTMNALSLFLSLPSLSVLGCPRTFRGDPAFAQRVPEEKLARLLNVFINELVRWRSPLSQW